MVLKISCNEAPIDPQNSAPVLLRGPLVGTFSNPVKTLFYISIFFFLAVVYRETCVKLWGSLGVGVLRAGRSAKGGRGG